MTPLDSLRRDRAVIGPIDNIRTDRDNPPMRTTLQLATATRPLVAVLAFDGISAFHLGVPGLVFGEDRRALGLPEFDYQLCGLVPGRIGIGGGAQIEVAGGPADLAAADIAIVPSWDPDRPVPEDLVAALGAARARGALVVGLCLGAFPVAAAGLLDGREAVTHWAWTAALAESRPAVRVLPDRLYVDLGEVVTSAGVAAGLDCCLHLVRRFWGAQVAARLARQVVMTPHRAGGQAQFIETPVPPDPAQGRFETALAAVAADPGAAHTLERVAAAAGLTRRSFTRRFRARSGESFGAWLARERLRLAQRLLEDSTHSVDRIAELSGLGSAANLRRHFATGLATTPLAYRRAFAG
jgi:AraC family transcriptional regulator, transcriptional activator FtrA